MNTTNRLAIIALLSSLSLAACSQAEQEQAEDQSQEAMQQADEAANDAGNAMEEAAEETKEAANEAMAYAEDKSAEASDFLSDAAITARVKAAFVEAGQVDAMAINVETIDGQVVLSGVVPTADMADLAEQLAEGIEGVSSVENDIEVQSY
ncbi:BON domain-containing protein [Pseudidiomarina terrestris]|uniref:BON domain-containing protein n=1 Tax=Pseudidiomarina terrestris TaxID=2820060 RepID=A0AAW7R2X9_9GAMM|nr:MULTISPECIES: BON domain-containing protein [unclassified Pseudidiomarina]MDN7125327.1 BON domain-containing protein [Pseudidiomarina sp. 1APP75-32.1]MDN7130086.1 BON domain-containing protein [Pseudidiomarina sp. 1APR75-15]MDN7135590.1 BON domain-containing protein [Pseudidiomarina sp. 1ASP75-5]MDN7137371.1 BON domain-containing protein [Pseudidiomarina sp. 1ASP75-14]MEA3589100.1 BON domain-containing protein [Pseudidiomarina sp. 1APP75-27a]